MNIEILSAAPESDIYQVLEVGSINERWQVIGEQLRQESLSDQQKETIHRQLSLLLNSLTTNEFTDEFTDIEILFGGLSDQQFDNLIELVSDTNISDKLGKWFDIQIDDDGCTFNTRYQDYLKSHL